MAARKAKAKTADTLNTTDGFANFLAHVGAATGNNMDGSHYRFSPLSRNRMQMDNAYRGSWIVGKGVDCTAEDMTRAGVSVHSDDDPNDIKILHKSVRMLNVWKSLCLTIKWSRLYGGAIAYMVVDGQRPDTPLKPDSVGKDQFKGLMSFDRWTLQPSFNELITDLGPDFGLPKYYVVVPDSAGGLPQMRIHYSRVIRFGGVDLPYYQRMAENLWGQSVLERLWDRLLAFDSTTTGAAQMAFKAHLRMLKIKDLRGIIAAGGPAQQGLVGQVAMMRAFQSNEGITLMDSEDDLEIQTYNFAGLSDMIMTFGQQLAGAIDTPLVRLFGQSPGGLNATGESDMRTYYDGILRQQTDTMANGLDVLYSIAYRSVFGREHSDSFEIQFNPLWQMDDEQKASIAATITDSVLKAMEGGAINRATAMKELKQQSRMTGVFSNIQDEDITEAEADPAPTPEALGLETTPKPVPGAKPGGDPKVPDAPGSDKKKALTKDDFNPQEPRDSDGKWTAGGAHHPRVEDLQGENDVASYHKDARVTKGVSGLWGSSHSASQQMAGYSATAAGIAGYKHDPLYAHAKREVHKFLTEIDNSPGSPERLFHGFQNRRGTQFKKGDTFSLPLTATSGRPETSASYAGTNDRDPDSHKKATMFLFEKGTPMAGYQKNLKADTKFYKAAWSEALIAGEFEVTDVTTALHHDGWKYPNLPVTVVHLKHKSNLKWKQDNG